MNNGTIQSLDAVLQTTFGFKEFRKGQREAIKALLNHGRLLSIQPTGHGKSLLYQLPACMLEGITLVISPLLALMRDQLNHLNHRFKIPAAAINSDQEDDENQLAQQAAFTGNLKVLFVAPEQLDHIDRFNFLLGLSISMVVVDEAHCISTWGHDFRPSYRQILSFLQATHKKNSHVKVLALTATADQRVEADIKRQLSFHGQEMHVMRETMNRPNICLSVIKAKGLAAKLDLCGELLSQLSGSGLIYCATRENVELVADYLLSQKFTVASYHAGYEAPAKRRLQEDFIGNKFKALVATNALGMGIDKSDLRYIIHFDVPGSITAYYQEVGRCGRDGLKASGILLFDPADKVIQEYFIEAAMPKPEDFQHVLQTVSTAHPSPNLTAIKRITGLHPTRVTIIIAELIEQQFLSKYSQDGTQLYRTLPKAGMPELSRYLNQHTVKTYELDQMLHFGKQTTECRMAILRRALGDQEVEKCQQCEICLQKNYTKIPSQAKLDEINAWLNERPLPIPPASKQKLSQGLSILDSKVRSPLFIRFMKERAKCEGIGMEDELFQLLKKHLSQLAKTHSVAGIVPIPSRTWKARDQILGLLARQLQLSVLDKLLFWLEMPLQRQGELLNNDQRHHNVASRMKAQKMQIPGTLILFDDYMGSGNTLKEAARAMRAEKINNEIIPFTIAAVKWHLGKPGFV